MNPDCNPDYVFDLNLLERSGTHANDFPLYGLPGGPYDEIHAYEVLEHFGRQGDYRGFFNTFHSFHMALKPGGLLIGSCPMPEHTFRSDPGHTRVISSSTLSFLTKKHYERLGKIVTSDYRRFVDPHWWICRDYVVIGNSFFFALETV